MKRVGEHDLEDLGQARLNDSSQQELMSAQTECTFVFRGDDGAPSGTVVSFAAHEGALWITSVRGRAQVRGVERDPEVSIVISNAGTDLPGRRMLSLRGTAQIHSDPTALESILHVLAERLAPGGEDAFLALLRSPGRVVIEVRPSRIVASHDSRRMAGNGRGGR
jgi:general stress protein 26